MYPDYKTEWYTAIGRNQLKVGENRKPEWKIHNEIAVVETYPSQKATAELGGRQWTAWFAKDLPLPEGSYKFYGLPRTDSKDYRCHRYPQFCDEGQPTPWMEMSEAEFI